MTAETPKSVQKWQEKLLPFLMRGVLILILAFLIVSTIETITLREYIYREQEQSFAGILQTLDSLASPTGQPATLESQRWHALVALEEQALGKRYRQARSVLMFNLYTRFLGFYTGMILALAGTVFVLGKIEDTGSEVDLTGVFGKAIAKGSPGIILAVLGTVLMLSTVVKEFAIDVRDAPIYIHERPTASSVVIPHIPLPKIDSTSADE